MVRTAALDQLQQVQELNRAFLELLQARVREQRASFALPLGGRLAIGTATAGLLDGVAIFPRALFHLHVGQRPRRELPEGSADFDDAERELSLSILFAARSTSRQSAYQARLLFELEPRDIDWLRASSLLDLQRLACEPGVLQCAFSERHWFWLRLLTTTRPELRRQLTLMALQPRIDDWPVRRPPHVIA